MPKRNFRTIIAGFILLFSVYINAILFHAELLANILSAGCALYGSAVLFWRYLTSEPSRTVSKSWLLYALALFFWGAADIDWLFLTLQSINPIESMLNTFLYYLANLFILASLLLFAFTYFRKWNNLQLIWDTVIISVQTLILTWILFLGKQSDTIALVFKDGFFSFSSIIIDVCVLIGVFVFFLSKRSGHIPSYVRIVSTGVSLFVIIDLIYYYSYFREQYIPNSLIDIVYAFSLILISLGAFLSMKEDNTAGKQIYIDNIGSSKKTIFLALFPLFALLSNTFKIFDFIIMSVVIVIYELISKQIQKAIKNEISLQEKLVVNQELEQQLLIQTNELLLLSNMDTVTKLYNKRYFQNSLDLALQNLSEGDRLAVVFLDLDRFKTINDTYGHDVGDHVLIEIAERLQHWNIVRCVIARIGGDEFVFMINGQYTTEQIEEFALQITALCNAPIFVQDQMLYVTVSIGIAIAPDDTVDSITLMKFADMAMYRAKSNGNNRHMFFDLNIDQHTRRKHEIELLLRKANIKSDFNLFYQPQFDLATNKLIGMEALLRWSTDQFGYISPSEFIPIAEEINLIEKIGKWVFTNACKQIRCWNETYHTQLKIGINLSPEELMSARFIPNIKQFLVNDRLLPDWIDIEITENIMLEHNEIVRKTFESLHELGLMISIDDFGTGYSSFHNLQHYPFNRIKIDKSLIDHIAEDNNNRHIVKAIIEMAKNIGLKTIAEGVETIEQKSALAQIGCDEVQGYLFGKPVPSDMFEQTYLKNKFIGPCVIRTQQ